MYRRVTIIVAWWDWILSIFSILATVLQGIYLFYLTLKNPGPDILIVWLLYFCSAFLAYLYYAAAKGLLKATDKTTDPETAVELCRLWVTLQWIVFGISIVINVALVLTYIYVRVSGADLFQSRRINNINTKVVIYFLLWCTCLALRGFALFSVNQFRKKLGESRTIFTTPTNANPDSAV